MRCVVCGVECCEWVRAGLLALGGGRVPLTARKSGSLTDLPAEEKLKAEGGNMTASMTIASESHACL